MPDFGDLNSIPIADIKRPKALPEGTYPGVIKNFEIVDAQPDKDYTKIIRFQVGLTGWPDNIDENDKLQDGPKGPQPIDVTKRQLRRDFYNGTSLYRCVEFLKSCGVPITESTTLGEAIPQAVGAQVQAEVQLIVSKSSGEFINVINGLAGEHGTAA